MGREEPEHMAALPVPPFPLGQGSGAIVSIDLHVVIGEVTAPALGSLVPLVQVHKDCLLYTSSSGMPKDWCSLAWFMVPMRQVPSPMEVAS